MRAWAAAATAGLALKATPRPAAPSMARSLAPSPTASCRVPRDSLVAHQLFQGGELGLLAEDGIGDPANQLAVLDQQRVGAVLVENRW